MGGLGYLEFYKELISLFLGVLAMFVLYWVLLVRGRGLERLSCILFVGLILVGVFRVSGFRFFIFMASDFGGGFNLLDISEFFI